MAVSLKNMKWYKTTSGFGGAITATELLSQTMTLSASITGVTVIDGADNALGSGSLRYVASGSVFYYTPPSGTEGLAVAALSNGEYVVRGAGTNGGYIRISVVFGSLPVTNQTRTVTVTNLANDLFDDVTKADSLAGSTEHRCIYLKNTHASDQIYGALLWINQDSIGDDSISIGLDPAGVGGTATTIASESAIPTGVVFSSPMLEASGLAIAAMTFGQSAAVWIRRNVPALTANVMPDDYSWLRYRILT